jgi:hypothetical protein
VLAQGFDVAAPVGDFEREYADSWCGYAEGTSDKYFNGETISAHDGMMDIALNGTRGAAGSFGTPSRCWGQLYGRYSMRFKAVGGSGNGMAAMLWPSSDRWGDGEIDFPEGDFAGTFSVHQHGLGCSDCSASRTVASGTGFSDWHVATIEWTPSGVRYYLDGSLLASIPDDTPHTEHRWTLQVGPDSLGPAMPGHLLVDWVKAYAYVPSGE